MNPTHSIFHRTPAEIRTALINESVEAAKTLEAGLKALRRIPRTTTAARAGISKANDVIAAAYEIELNKLARLGEA